MLKIIHEPTPERLFAERRASDLKDLGKSADEVIQILRDDNVSILHAILALRSVFSIGAREAKDKVSSHVAWRRIAEQSDAFHAEIIDEIEKAAHSTDGSEYVQKTTS